MGWSVVAPAGARPGGGGGDWGGGGGAGEDGGEGGFAAAVVAVAPPLQAVYSKSRKQYGKSSKLITARIQPRALAASDYEFRPLMTALVSPLPRSCCCGGKLVSRIHSIRGY